MEWKKLLSGAFHYNYAVTNNLFDLVDDSELNWKPSTGSNWMTVGQLLYHITEANGACCRGFVTGDWGLPADYDPSKPPDEMMTPAEKMKAVGSVAEAKRMLKQDRKLAFEMLDQCSEERLDTEIAKAPWDNMDICLGQRLLQMDMHLSQHKGQLFYYLKLMGKPVNTGTLWGA